MLSVCLSVFVYPSVSVCPAVCLSMSVLLPVCLTLSILLSLSVLLSVCLCLSCCLSVYGYLLAKSCSIALNPSAAVKSIWFMREQSITTGILGPALIIHTTFKKDDLEKKKIES